MIHSPQMRLLAVTMLGSVSGPVLAQGAPQPADASPTIQTSPTSQVAEASVPDSSVLAAIPTSVAAAPSATSDTGDIVVTAQRREQSLLSVPLANSAVSGQGLTAKGVVNSARLATAVPNLQVHSAYGNKQPSFSLRGVGVANEYNSDPASPIGGYMDDDYKESRSRPTAGIVTFRHELLNQRDELVCRCLRAALLHQKAAA